MLVLKFILGGLIVVLLSLVSQSRFFIFAGLIPLFPTFAFISNVMVLNNQGIEELKETLLFGVLSLIPYLAYLLSLYLTIGKYKTFFCFCFAFLAWGIFAFLIYYLYNFFR